MNIVLASEIIKVLELMRSDIVGSKLAVVMSLATVIGALLAGIVLLKLAHDYIEGQGITLWTMLRPVVILLCVCNFNSFVAGPIHGIVNIMTNGMSHACSVSANQYLSALAQQAVRGGNALSPLNRASDFVQDFQTEYNNAVKGGLAMNKESGSKVEKMGFFKKAITGIVAAVHAAGKSKFNFMSDISVLAFEAVVAPLLYFVMNIVFICQQCLCYIYLTLLTLLGPFAFSFSIIGWFNDSIRSWVAKYVQIAFWIPVGHLVMFCCYRIMIQMSQFDSVYSYGKGWIHVICLIASIISVCSVPKIASMIIESSGAGGAESAVAGLAKSGAGAAASAIVKAVA